MNVKAKGILRHRFWGEYSAVIALEFSCAEHASASLSMLGDGWKIAKEPRVLLWVGSSAELEACTRVLVSFGAEEKKIASLAKSIDYGEPFEIEIVGIVSPNQLGMFP